ncbi:elongation factor P 5-aminopentanone reductase [Proteiniclasticum sp. C24MP]|uniref:elongation factor P 5-aminopentanone reductase n=1 Tax=Proteiniclasticum sp. C24MP TaxID=3374101 RepID=UPI00375414FC
MKNAIITGATGGIGKEIARKLAGMGYNLALVYGNNHTQAKMLMEELSEITRAEAYSMDFSSTNGYSLTLKRMLKDFGSFEVLIHGAGVSYRDLFHEMNELHFEELLSINLKPLYYVSKEIIPSMIEAGKGSIISISSIWGSKPASMEVAYAMTKGALEQFTRSLASELSHMNIRVNAIAPGGVDTKLLANLTDQEKMDFIEDIPFKRLAKPEEVAELAAFLIEKGTYITGQVLTMDGGFTL